jgi:tripartite-type tricarboxylate transporter receptor subunit TctC
MLTKRALLTAMGAAGCCMLAVKPALAQAYPSRPIKVINPFAPGGLDFAARIIADRLSLSLGQPIIFENRSGGAGGTVGARSVAVAEPDGYTLLFSTPGPLVVATSVYRNLGYDPVKSFAPVATIFSSPHMLVVRPSVPVNSMQELVDHARSNPGRINFASPGYGTLSHLLGEMFRLMTSAEIVHVAYRGAGPAVAGLLAGEVQMYFEYVPILLPHIENGNLRALAVADDTRSLQLPSVRTTIESGFPKLQSTFWSGILAPAGTPAGIVNRLNGAINKALQSTEFEASLAKLGAKPKIGSPGDFANFMSTETQKWAEVASAAGITAE